MISFRPSTFFKTFYHCSIYCILLAITACGGSDSPAAPTPPDPISIESISISPYQITVANQSSMALQVTAIYSNGIVGEALDEIDWSVQDSTIGQINAEGILSALSVGETTVNASVGGVSASANLTVTAASLVSINISPGSVSVPSGTKRQLQVTGIYSDQSVQDLTAQASWLSSNNGVSTVNVKGVLSAHSPGSAVISASINGQSFSIAVDVTSANLTSIVVTPSSLSLPKGTQYQLQAIGIFSDQSTLDLTSQVKWSSNKISIISVNAKGRLIAVSTGSATVTAMINGKSGSTVVNVTAAVLSSLNISPGVAGLAKGTQLQLQVTGVYSDSTVQDLTAQVSWQSSEPSIAEVSPAGILTGHTIGTSIVTSSLNGVNSSISVTVSAATLTEINISAANLSLAKGTNVQLQATGVYSDFSTQDITSQLSWQSDNASVLSINSNGLLSAIEQGSATITAAISGVNASVIINVTAASLTAIKITPAVVSIAAGTELQFIANGHFSDGSSQDITPQVSWSLSQASIAEPVGYLTGRFRGISEGSGFVIAALDGIKALVPLTVTSAVLESLEIVSTVTSLAAGTVTKLQAIGRFSDGSNQNLGHNVDWMTSDQSVASIDKAGLVKAHSIGVVTLTALFEGLSASYDLSVSNALLTEIEITPLLTQLPVGSDQKFTATGIYSDGTTQDITSQVVWSSSDNGIISVNNSQGMEGDAQSINTGLATIFAQSGSIISSKSLSITNAVIANINIDPANAVISIGFSKSYAAIAVYTDGTTKDITSEAEWSTSGIHIASSKDIASEIHGFSKGQVTISASKDGVSGLANLDVSDAVLTSITLNSLSTTVAKGTQYQYIATGHYSDGSSHDISTEVDWSSNMNTVAAIYNGELTAGLVNALSEGVATITATLKGVTVESMLTVSAATLQSISLSTGSNLLLAGEKVSIFASGTFSDSSVQDVTNLVTWQTSANDIAAISNAGKNKGQLLAYAPGSVSITAVFMGLVSAALDLTVQNDPDAPLSISMTALPNAIFNNDSDSSVIRAVLQPAGVSGVIADNTLVDFMMTKNGVTSTVTSATINGVAEYTFTTADAGLYSIAAKVQGTEITTSTVVLSVASFNEVLIGNAYLIPLFDSNYLYAGSEYGLLVQNISNRDFIINTFHFKNGTNHLSNSPVAGININNGVLSGGQALWIISVLDENIVDNGVSATIFLNDSSTPGDFGFGVNYITPQ